jgi:hypothetical protein
MPRNYHRKTDRASWSASALEQALRSIKQSEKTIGEAAVEYGIPKTTLHRHLRGKSMKKPGIASGRCPVLNDKFEQELVDHIKHMQRIMFGLTPMEVRRIAFQLAERNHLKHPFSHKTQLAGEDWFLSFCNRHPEISLRRPEATSMSRVIGFNEKQVKGFYEILKEEMTKYEVDASRIWNVDESGLTSVHKPPKIMAIKGMKQVGKLTSGERGKTITVICCFNAAGTYVPPTMIFPRKNMNDRLMKGAPPNTLGLTSASGWINEEIFIIWLKHFNKHVKPSKDRKHIIILDGHSSHKSLEAIETARDSGIVLISLPPHTTHRMQPLDLVFYGPLKTAYNRQADNWMISNPGKRITDYEVAEIFGTAYSRVANIDKGISGFKASGIFPFDSEKFSQEDFATLPVSSDSSSTADQEARSRPTVQATIQSENQQGEAAPAQSQPGIPGMPDQVG